MEYAGFFVLLLFACIFLCRMSRWWFCFWLAVFYAFFFFFGIDFEKFPEFSWSICISAPIIFICVSIWLWINRKKEDPVYDDSDVYFDAS